jgi:protein involved in sex pheromone biosynthesis
MKKQNLFTLLGLACAALTLFAAGCTDQKVEEANKFVDSANKKSDEFKSLMTKATESFDKVMKDMDDFDAGKKAHESDLKDIVKNYDKVMELAKGAASDFTEAAKANSNEKFKAYYEMSAKDMEKTGEVVNQNKEMANAILNSSDDEAYVQKMTSIQSKTESLTKESDDIRAKLKKLEAEVTALNKG